jgi:hypothetical protein
MSGYAPGSRSPEIGADSILYLVETPQSELDNGEFYEDGIKRTPSYETDFDLGNYHENYKKITIKSILNV